MLRREIPTAVFIALILIVLVIVGAIYWRKIGGGRTEIILKESEKPFPVPPAIQKQRTTR